MKTFKHSGDIGDILYSLPVIKSMGGGVLYLDITGGVNESACINQCIDKKTKFNRDGFLFLEPLLRAQSYIHDVLVYNNEHIDINLDHFRLTMLRQPPNIKKNLLELHIDTFNLPSWNDNEPWLLVDNFITRERKTLVSRSPRMQSNFPWFQTNKFNFAEKAAFVGLKREHDLFEWTFDISIPFYPTANALELARLIAGCKAFVGNSSSALAIAIGLGHVPIVQEVVWSCPASVFQKKTNMNYV